MRKGESWKCKLCLTWNDHDKLKCSKCRVNPREVWTCSNCAKVSPAGTTCISCGFNKYRAKHPKDGLKLDRSTFLNAVFSAGLVSKPQVPKYLTRKELEEKTTFDGSRLSLEEAFTNLMKAATIDRHISSDALKFVRQVVKNHAIKDETTVNVLKSLSLSHAKLKELQIIHDSKRAEQIRRKLRQDYSYAEDKLKEFRDGTRIPKIEAFATILRIATVNQRLSPSTFEFLNEIASVQVIDEVDRKQAMILARTSDDDMKEMLSEYKDGGLSHPCHTCKKRAASCVAVECMHAFICKTCFESPGYRISQCPFCLVATKEVRRLF